MADQILDPKTSILNRKILFKKREGKYSSIEELNRDLYKLGETALKEGNFYHALSVYIELNDRKKVRLVGKKCLQGEDKWLFDATKAFEFLKDKKGMFEVIKIAEEEPHNDINLYLERYMGRELIQKNYENFKKWALEKGFQDAYGFGVAEAVNMAYTLSNNYDLGIGTAKGGLYLTYIFSLFGLETKIVEAHRTGTGATFNWNGDILPEGLKNKNIVVFDKDVVSGRTTKRVSEELQKYQPKKVDLVLIHNPIPEGSIGFGSNLSRVSKHYNEVYYPKRFKHNFFDKAVNKLEQILKQV